MIEQLKEQPLLRGLDGKTLEYLSGVTQARRYDRGAFLLHQGDPYEELLLLSSGTAAAEMTDSNGKSMLVEELVSPDVVASGVLFAEDNDLPVSLRAKTEVEALACPKKDFLHALTLDRALLERFLGELSGKLMLLSRRLSFLTFKSIRSKVAHYLVALPLRPGNRVELPRSIEDLASYFGVARPALSKVLIQMAEEGLLEHRGREVKLLDIEGLLDMAE